MTQELTDIGVEKESMEGIIIHDEISRPPIMVSSRSSYPELDVDEIEKEWEKYSSMGFTPLLKVNSEKKFSFSIELVIVMPTIRSYSKNSETGEYTIPNFRGISPDKTPMHLYPGKYFVTEEFPGVEEDYYGFNHPVFGNRKVFFIVKEEIEDSDKTRIRQIPPSENMIGILDRFYEDSQGEQSPPRVKLSKYFY
jgi:hypothetical protein